MSHSQNTEKPDAIEEYLMTSDSKVVKVLLWLLKNRDSKNQICGTLDYIAADCNVTKVTVNRVFQRLYKDGFMAKERNGLYTLYRV